jgi:hypothetical protein
MWALQRIAVAVVCLTCLPWGQLAAESAPGAVPEYHLKTVFLYNLAKFTNWPEGALEPSPSALRIGVLDDTHIRPAFRLIADKRVGGRPLELSVVSSPRDADDCAVVFLNGDDSRLIQLILQRVRKRPILTVGEGPAFIRWGGIIRFRMEDGHARLEASLENALTADLTLKAQLLQLCRIIKDTKAEGRKE